MINIDDLVRRRLEGGQESERPGAWLSMRELLDKEMPVAVATGSSRRRIIGYFTGLLLLATASVGGYKLYHQSTGPDAAPSGGSGLTASTGSDIGALPPITAPIANEGIRSAADNSNQTPSVNNNTASSSFTSANAPAGRDSRANHSSNSITRTSGQISTTQSPNTNVKDLASSNDAVSTSLAQNQPENQSPVLSASAASVSENRSTATDPATRNLRTRSIDAAQASSAPVFSANNTTTEAGAINGSRNAPTTARPQPVDSRVLSSSAKGLTGPTTVKPSVTAPPSRYVHDTIEAIELVAHRIYDASIQKVVYRIDTFPKGHMIVKREVPVPAAPPGTEPARTERRTAPRRGNVAARPGSNPVIASSAGKPAATAETAITPASAPAAATTEDAKAAETNLAALSALKATNKIFGLWDAQKFEEAVDKFKFKMANIQVYPGVMGGINASIFTPNSLGGFQMGLTSLFALNEWWSLMVELKYLHRFNTGSTVRDDYMAVKPGSGTIETATINNQPYKRYTWQEEHVEHFFNYEVVRTVEMPLLARYNSGRFYWQGGVNLVYSMGIDAKEVTRAKGDFAVKNKAHPASQPVEPFNMHTSPLVQGSDFGPRFGTGYVLGGGFSFTPSVYMDLRLSQTFWDNAKTMGARQISNDLLRTPSIQLSLGYRFMKDR